MQTRAQDIATRLDQRQKKLRVLKPSPKQRTFTDGRASMESLDFVVASNDFGLQ